MLLDNNEFLQSLRFQEKLKQREKFVNKISKAIKWDKMALENFKKTIDENDNELDLMMKFMKLDKKLVDVSYCRYNY